MLLPVSGWWDTCQYIIPVSQARQDTGQYSKAVPVPDQDGLEPGTFDTITCFSVTKWIHLNGGDEALQALLARIHSLLAPNGRAILEPQQWVSYKKAMKKPVSTFLVHATPLAMYGLPLNAAAMIQGRWRKRSIFCSMPLFPCCIAPSCAQQVLRMDNAICWIACWPTSLQGQGHIPVGTVTRSALTEGLGMVCRVCQRS